MIEIFANLRVKLYYTQVTASAAMMRRFYWFHSDSAVRSSASAPLPGPSRPLMIIVNCASFLQHNLMDFLWSLNTLEEWQIGIVKPVNFLPSQAIFIGSQNQNDHFIFLMYLPSS